MKKVLLTGVGLGDASYPLEQAQAMLDLTTPPKVWFLSKEEKNFELKDGKLVEITKEKTKP